MVALRIEDVKGFTSKLFLGNIFDIFLVREACIVTFNSFTIDGRIRQGYYTEQELEENKIEELSSWEVLKPVCFSLIKGKKLPERFQITLQLSPESVEKFLQYSQLDLKAEQIGGIYVNVRYEDQVLYCISGTSLKVFTLDRSIEMEWDEALRLFLRQSEIVYTENREIN